ncbi:CPBP family intramembrane glutamic endopeptidase [Cellulomonas shaoxiangyii]|uniref:CPBP family intramembrane metalloprotease n=1 Tax=Cellulomonas shaoxiangyii TaxID=2566013 RepID=A0A4P7SIF7_9CELL|nr:type II CAAX endopeptidase family protein [Cellulomonas shaoxiangyii]QCB92444.1 CPBP family intramembrane metalloprotease [Cellulomonas shaoxiangyii]TGY85647.1 CPBP family intramembrane metalloprotease [Cellulomonas shaoxiangyii]
MTVPRPVPPAPQGSAAPTPPLDASVGPERVPWRAVAVFVLVACGLAWLVATPLWTGDGADSPLFAPLAAVMMWTPAAAVLIVTLVLRTPARDRLRALGIRPLRPVRRTLGLTALGLVAPVAVVAATTLLAGALGLVDLDLVGLSGFAAQVEGALPAGTAMPPVGVLLAAQLLAIPFAALVNSLVAFGEEVGWRGWLLPALLPLGTWPALLVSGAVWGLWHAPLVLLGYNFERTDVTGVLLMVGGCVAWGVLLGWLRLRSASLWPAVVAHGSLNAVGALVLLLVAAGHTPDMAVAGPLGLVAWGVLAAVAVVLVATGQLGVRPAPGPATAAVPAPGSPSTPAG